MEPKFVADNMVGRLGRRLRMLGYDTLFPKGASDQELEKIARTEDRILLTRDTELVKQTRVKALLIKSTVVEKQVKQVLQDLNLKIDKDLIFTRCLECNTPIEEIGKEKVKGKIPELVSETVKDFKYCPKCKRIYWKGSHYDKMFKLIEELHK